MREGELSMLKNILQNSGVNQEWTHREESTSYRKKCWSPRIFQIEKSRTPWDSERESHHLLRQFWRPGTH